MRKIKIPFKDTIKYCKVDDDWYEILKLVKWNLSSYGYASRSIKGGKSESMHRLILGAFPGQIVDHINMNPLDNRIANLRIVNKQQNSFNMQKRHKNTTSKYKGVSYRKDRKKWRAYIVRDNKQFTLGHYDNEIDAAKAYDFGAIRFHGEHARLNFPEDCISS